MVNLSAFYLNNKDLEENIQKNRNTKQSWTEHLINSQITRKTSIFKKCKPIRKKVAESQNQDRNAKNWCAFWQKTKKIEMVIAKEESFEKFMI